MAMSSKETGEPSGPVERPQATVVVYPSERAQIRKTSIRLFGRDLELWEYAGLCGAPDDAIVEVGTFERGLYFEFYPPGDRTYQGVRLVREDADGPVLIDDGFHIFDPFLQRRQFGLRMFRRQLQFAVALGIRRIQITAGRRHDENGYYTWPRFGFDGPLPQSIRKMLPEEFRQAKTVLDLIDSPTGRTWWRENGVTTYLEFDLAPGSRSRRTFDSYIAEKTPCSALVLQTAANINSWNSTAQAPREPRPVLGSSPS